MLLGSAVAVNPVIQRLGMDPSKVHWIFKVLLVVAVSAAAVWIMPYSRSCERFTSGYSD